MKKKHKIQIAIVAIIIGSLIQLIYWKCGIYAYIDQYIRMWIF